MDLLQTGATETHALPAGRAFVYGTAGFRTLATVLDGVCFRVGFLAAGRSLWANGINKSSNSNSNVDVLRTGVMVTASHNPEADNGVKIVDADGGMLDASWESFATQMANAPDAAAMIKVLDAVLSFQQSEATGGGSLAALAANLVKEGGRDCSTLVAVTLGRDTRVSSPGLAAAAADGVRALFAVLRELADLPAEAEAGAADPLVDLGVVTTPQLHFAVRQANLGEPGDEEAYYAYFADAFVAAIEGAPAAASAAVYVDGANGVGAGAARKLSAAMAARGAGLELHVLNDGSAEGDAGVLNLNCGADFVKTRQRQPEYGLPASTAGKRFASLDGDADRLMYWALDDEAFTMLDGDKIAVIFAAYIKKEVEAASLAEPLSFGVVQTAYANGASTAYMEKELGLTVACTPTGVKHLHHEAKNYDVGIYFEANGHGTILFSERYSTVLKGAESTGTEVQQAAVRRLANLPRLVNQAIGDALSDLLLVEVAMRHMSWTLEDWAALYADAPNRLLAQQVPDRNMFKTTDAERKLTSPAGLQEQIDAAMKRRTNGRSFVRPSGTEDVVRIYAEAASRGEADELADEVAQLVIKAGGQS